MSPCLSPGLAFSKLCGADNNRRVEHKDEYPGSRSLPKRLPMALDLSPYLFRSGRDEAILDASFSRCTTGTNAEGGREQSDSLLRSWHRTRHGLWSMSLNDMEQILIDPHPSIGTKSGSSLASFSSSLFSPASPEVDHFGRLERNPRFLGLLPDLLA